MNRLAMALTASLIATTSPAQAGYYDGNALHTFCQEGDDLGSIQCMLYIAGAVDAVPTNCVPAGTRLEAVKDVVKRYLAQHPEHRIYGAEALVHVAISEVWGAPGECR